MLANQKTRTGWWGNRTWTVTETASRWGRTLDEWRELSVEAKYEMIAYCRAKDVMDAWATMEKKERIRAYQAYIGKKKDG